MVEDLKQAVKRTEEAAAAPQGRILAKPSIQLSMRSEDPEKVIKNFEAGLAATPPEDGDRVWWLVGLSILLSGRYEKFGAVEDLEQAIKHSEAALVVGPLEDSRARQLGDLGARLSRRYERLRVVGDLKQAIKNLEEAPVATPPEHSDRARRIANCNLGSFLLKRYERFGVVKDLEQAIKYSEAALAATPPEHNDRSILLPNLGLSSIRRYAKFGAVEGLEKAIEYSKAALAATPPEHNRRSMLLTNLGSSLSDRYVRFGAVEDLEKAIKYSEEALAAAPPEHKDRAVILTNLCLLFYRYVRFGAVEDLEQAIKYSEAALAATPPEHNRRSMLLANLGLLLSGRYVRFGAVEDLEQAIKYSEEALAATPPEHIGRARGLHILSGCLANRYERFEAVGDLEQAIKYSEAALAATPSEHNDRVGQLNELSSYLMIRYNKFGAVEDLEQSIKHSEAALAATPSEHNDRVRRLDDLSVKLLTRYNRFGAVEDLEQGIKHSEAALVLAATSPETVAYPFVLRTLAGSLIARYERTNSLLEFYRIIHILHLYLRIRTPPLSWINVAWNASILFASKKMWEDSSSTLADAVKLLPRVSSRTVGRKDQEYRLSGLLLTRIVSTSVSVALQAGEDASYCLRLFELSRGVIMGLVIDCRSDLSELQEKHPAIFEKFHSLRVEIDSPPTRINPNALLAIHGPTYEQVRDRRQLVANQLEETLVSIRELPGFEGFQLPPHAHYLMSMASDGPIVIFNSTEFRSDAIIVTSSSIKELRLRKLIFEEAEEWIDEMRNLTSGPRSTYGDRNSRMLKMLQWLWDVAVEPVCKALQLDPVADDTDLPRVWWIGAGPLATAPFHAAGNPKSKNNTMSRAISSYIPTIKALSYARQKNLELLGKKDSRILLVTMPTTPGKQWSPLPGVVKEAKNIADLAEGKAHTTQLECPSAAQVLAELPSHDAIHFACHGKSDPKSPSNSALQLQPENESGEPDRLTVEAISNMKIQRAQIAYLSACCTAENASEDLADESIYIASGFQLAGFSHVLATQWVSMDKACLQVSGEFYRLLFDGQPCGSKGGHRKVSSSFHSAVKKLRDANWRQPVMWASFIHTGV